MFRAEVLETMMYGCITWSPRACHYKRAHRNLLTHCIGWRKNDRADDPISYHLGTLIIKTGSESIKATLRRRRILFVEFVARRKDTRLPKRGVRRIGGRRGLRGRPGKRVDGVFPGKAQSIRHQRRSVVEDCSPGREGMTQDGGTRGGTFHGETDRRRESQG